MCTAAWPQFAEVTSDQMWSYSPSKLAVWAFALFENPVPITTTTTINTRSYLRWDQTSRNVTGVEVLPDEIGLSPEYTTSIFEVRTRPAFWSKLDTCQGSMSTSPKNCNANEISLTQQNKRIQTAVKILAISYYSGAHYKTCLHAESLCGF